MLSFSTKKEALEFMRNLDAYQEYRGGLFCPRGTYHLAHGEYEAPDYKPVRYKDGWGIKQINYFYPGTFYARSDGRCECHEETLYFGDIVEKNIYLVRMDSL